MNEKEAIFIYPMHPEFRQEGPGSCQKCGMAFELKTITAEEEESPELSNMTLRFKVSTVLTVQLVIITMRHYIPGLSIIDRLLSPEIMKWLELVLATPVVLWWAWTFFGHLLESEHVYPYWAGRWRCLSV